MRARTIKGPQNILITHVYSSANKGDAALTSVLLRDLQRKFPKAKLTILKLEPGKEPAQFEGVAEIPSFMSYVANNYHFPLLKLAYALYMMGITLSYAAWRYSVGRYLYVPPHLAQIIGLYKQADLVVAVGGGYIRSRKGLMMRFNVPLLLHPLLLGHLLGIPTVLYSQSVGPFYSKFDEWLTAVVLQRMTLIMLREDTSVALLERLGVTHNVVRTIDSGFLLRSKYKIDVRKKYHIPADALLIGVTVRSWLTGGAQEAYEKAVAGALDDIVEKFDTRILFIPQVTAAKGDDDRMVSRRVHQQMKCPAMAAVITDEPDHYKIKAIYDGLDLLLGTRFHSVIFSLTSYVPVLAIEYEHKTSGIMQDLGLSQWVIKIEDVTTAKLIDALYKLLRQRRQYKAHLQNRLPGYLTRARRTISLLEKTYHNITLLPRNQNLE